MKQHTLYTDDDLYKKIQADMVAIPSNPSFNKWLIMVIKFYFENRDKCQTLENTKQKQNTKPRE